jgi:LEA14-like dessication related protein
MTALLDRAVVKFSALVLVIALASAACAPRWVDFEVRRVRGVHVTAVDDDGMDVIVTSDIANPNRVGATLHNIEFRAATGPHALGRGALPGPVTANARSEFSLKAPMRIRYADLPADLPARVATGRLPLTVHTSLAATTALGTFAMNLAWTGETEIARLLEVALTGSFRSRAVRVQSIRLAGVGLFRMSLVVRVVMYNAFPFAVHIRGGALDLYVAGQYFGNTRITAPILLAPGHTETREFVISAAHLSAWRTLRATLDSSPRFRARGTLHIDPIAGVAQIPVDIRMDSSVFARP